MKLLGAAMIGASIGVMVLFLFIVLLWSSGAYAHDWYSGITNEKGESCCGGNDCAAIPDEDVTPVPGGYQVHVPNFKGGPVQGFVPNSRAKPAKEGGEYHLCYYGQHIACFFYPAPSY